MHLRPYQEEAVRGILTYAVAHPHGRLLLVVPPRGGKTPIASTAVLLMAHQQGYRALWCAHRRELVTHARDHLIESGIPAEMIGVIMAGDKRSAPGAPIQIASVDTLSRRDKPPAEIVVTDEAHRDASEGRRKLRALYPHAFRLGLTGTPCRADGRGLAEDYDEMFCVSSPSELIADGYLMAPRVFTVPSEFLPNTKGVKIRGGDFEQEALERVTNQRVLVGSIVEHWKRLAEGRRTFAFPVSIKHSLHIVEQFRAAGVDAEHVDGDTPMAQRERVLSKLADGKVQMVSSCGVFSEGTNVPQVKCAILARPTWSLALHIQQSSRPLTPWRDVSALVLDHAGNVMRKGFGFPHEDRKWSLCAARRDRNKGEAPVKICEQCHAIVGAGSLVCNECGWRFRETEQIPEELAQSLRELRPTYSQERRDAEWERIRVFAAAKNLPIEWAKRVFSVRVDGHLG